MPLSGIPISDSVDFPLTGYHIIGNSLTASADTTPPTMVVQHSDGSTIPDGGFSGENTLTVVVNDAGSGVQELEAFTGAPVLNGWANLQFGFASPLFRDSNLSGTSSTSTITLTYLAQGTTVWIESTDAAGNVSGQSVQVDRVPPTIAVQDVAGNPIGTATSSTTVVVVGTDTIAGIASVVLTGPSGSTIQESGQTTVSETFSGLADGSYSAIVYNAAGVASPTLSFNRGKASFLVGAQLRDVCKNRPFVALNFSEGSLLYRQAGRLSELISGKEPQPISLGRIG